MRRILCLIAVLLAALTITSDAQQTIQRADQYVFGQGGLTASRRILTGSGSPEGAVTAPVGTVYLRTDGGDGTTLYIKSTGSGNTGWTAAATTPGSAAPANASYITKVAEGDLTNEFALGSLASALLVNTTTTGVPAAYTGTTCTNQFVRALSVLGVATCNTVSLTAAADVTGVLPTANGGTGQNSTATFPTSGVVVTADSMNTLTNKTVDAEGTGNLITVPFKVHLRAAYCQNATPLTEWSLPVMDAAVPACDTGANIQKGTLEFADGADTLSAETQLWLPTDWVGTVSARIRWFTAATTGNVVWHLATACVADGQVADVAFNTASTVTDAAQGTTLFDNDAAIASVDMTGCAAGESLYLRFFRDPTDGSDTLADTAILRALELTMRRGM